MNNTSTLYLKDPTSFKGRPFRNYMFFNSLKYFICHNYFSHFVRAICYGHTIRFSRSEEHPRLSESVRHRTIFVIFVLHSHKSYGR